MAPRKSDDSAASRRPDSLPPLASRDAKISKSPRPASRPRPKRPPGRPFKIPSRSSSSQSRSGRSERPSASPSVAPDPSPTPSRRTLSMLEALPVEIIEQIFLNCLNLNLPRASRVLATALSRERLYKVLIILAFWDDPIVDGQDARTEAIERTFAPLEYVPLTLEQRRKLQEQIFRCRWCTMKRIQEQIPQIMNLSIHRKWIDPGFIMEPDQKEALDRFMARKDNKSRVFEGKGPVRPHVLTDTPEFEFRLHLRPNEGLEFFSNMEPWRRTCIPALGLLTFPSYLLRGRHTGFTEEDIWFLEMLRMCSHQHGTSPAHPVSKARIDREALHVGVQRAIRTQNLDALTTLLKIDEFICRFSTLTTITCFYSIPSDHFITATQYGRDNPVRNVAIFEALIRASAESLPPKAREITEWIIHMSEEIARRGLKYPEVNTRLLNWLSDFMLRLPAHIDAFWERETRQIFVCGGVFAPDPDNVVGQLFGDEVRQFLGDDGDQFEDEEESESLRFVNEVLRPERTELADYMFESPYRPADFW